MSIFSRLFGSKKEPPAPKPQPKPLDLTEGLDYMEVRSMEDPVQRIALTRIFADKGDPIAQYDLGQAYFNGRDGLPNDWEKAEHYLLLSDAQDFVNASYLLGCKYIRLSFLGEPDYDIDMPLYEKGCRYLAKAALNKHIVSLMVLNGSHKLGWNTHPDLAKLLKETVYPYMEDGIRKLESGEAEDADYILGLLYEYGVYYPQDFGRAKEFFLRCGPEDNRAWFELEKPVFAFDEDDEDEE